MSAGILCQCPTPGHVRGNGEPACPRYAMNQTLGGRCASCAAGFHEPCPRVVLPLTVTAGECLRCRWHSSEHLR